MSIKKFLESKLQDNSQKHGKWIKDENNMVHCSLCEQMPLMGLVSTPYCPWCGAVMEKELKSNPKKATWEKKGNSMIRSMFSHCSNCQEIASPETPFCPHCGARTNYWDTFDDND